MRPSNSSGSNAQPESTDSLAQAARGKNRMKRANFVIVRACSWLTVHTKAFLIGLTVVWMAAAPSTAWGQSAVWLPQGATTGNIYYNGGGVGIGTTNPGTKLSVVSSGSIDGLTLSSVNRSSIWFTTTGPYNWNWLLQNAVSSNGDFQFLASTAPGGAPITSIMTLQGAGNVGIGTTNPQYKLAVNGNIGAQDIIVTNTGWSDYVFRPGYRLRPLSEVSAFIQKNRHLPDIPSEAEVKAQGVSLSEMQAKLLAKIEELTLHMIQQDKENRALRERIARLEKGAAARPTSAPEK